MTFLIVGAQKAGTTALYRYLSADGDIVLAPDKEVHYFDNDGLDWSHPNHEAYHAQFPRQDGLVRGEATPIYAYWPNSIERIAAYNPSMRLIFLLRDPVERAWSHWRMEYARGAETKSFAWCIREGRQRLHHAHPRGHHRVYSYVERGFYAGQLERIYRLFPREQVFILRSEDLHRRPASVLANVRAFIGAAPGPPPTPALANVGQALDYGSELRTEDIGLLRQLYAADNALLLDLAGFNFDGC